jgi:hypothetical protein
MNVYHTFKRISQKLAIKIHKTFDPAEKVDPTDFEQETVAICRNLISREDSELLISPVSGKRYIKNPSSQIFFIIQDGMVDIINHTYSYNVRISLKAYQRLIKAFDHQVEMRRQAMEDEIRSNVKHSLKTIFTKLSHEQI